MKLLTKNNQILNQKTTKKLVTKASPKIKMKRAAKVFSLGLIYLVFLSSIISLSGYLIYNNQYSLSYPSFNPDSDLDNWNYYYDKHEKDHDLIDINNMISHFNKKENSINISVKDEKETTLQFSNLIKEIDNHLISNKLEASDISDDSNSILPNQFFQNVIYNPDIVFTTKNDKGNEVPAQTFPYKIGEINGQTKQYRIEMNILSDASNYGIKVDKNTTIAINVNITNNIIFDLDKLIINFKSQCISMEKAGNLSINDMLAANPQIKQDIAEQFTKQLEKKVSKKIASDAYTIAFENSDIPVNFNDKGVDVHFSINAKEQAKKYGFKGALKNPTIHITNEQINLNNCKDLTNKIEANYKTKALSVQVNNDKTNDDTNLSQIQIEDINQQIKKQIDPICLMYFKNSFPELHVQTSDYDVTSNLKQQNNIFNQKAGLKISLTISPNENSTKFVKGYNLVPINIAVLGTNKNTSSQTWSLPDKFANYFEGIWLPKNIDKDILQDGEHYYEQDGKSSTSVRDSLLQELVTSPSNSDSLLKKIQKNSYNIDSSSFKGNFIFSGILDQSPWNLNADFSKSLFVKNPNNPNQIMLDVTKISNPTKGVNNFYDLISKTQSIYLYTNVSRSEQSRSLQNVSINFYNNNSSDASALLYSIDFSPIFNGVSIRSTASANFKFDTFQAQFTYDQWN